MTRDPVAAGAAYVPHRVLALVDDDLVVTCALLRRFVDDTPGAWRAIEEAIAGGKPAAIAQSVHYLRGSLALVEADVLTTRMTTWERDALRGSGSVSTSEVAAVRDALATLMRGIGDFLDRTRIGDVAEAGSA